MAVQSGTKNGDQSGCNAFACTARSSPRLPELNMSYDYLRSAPIRRLRHPPEEKPVWKILGSAVASAFAVAVSLPFLLVFFFLVPACLSLRWLLLFIHRSRRGSCSGHGPEPAKGNDRRWLGTAWTSSVIHAVLIFETNDRLNVENFRQILLARVVPLYPRLTRRPISLPLSAGIGHCWLQDTNFSIEKHVFPGPSLSSEKDLQSYLSKLLKDGLPQDKPPWEFQILRPFGEREETVAVLRVHQSVADGTALLRVLCQSLADSQEIEVPQGSSFGSFSFCVNVFRACIIGPLSLLVWLFFSAEDRNVLTRRSAWTGSVTVTWSASITLPKVIRIKQVTRSTVNCVLLSALAGAVRRFLQGCGVKHPPDVKAALSMDLRNRDSSRRIGSRLGNKTSSVFISLPVAVEGCIPRLWTTRKTLSSLRNSADPVILYVATAALMSVGPSSFTRGLVDLLADKASLQFSSLPGPASEIYVGGQTLKAIYPLLPAQAKLGISVTAITYADKVFVSVIAERGLGPAAQLILEYLEDQIEILWNLLLHRRVPGESRNSVAFTHLSSTDGSVRDIASRLNYVQQEVQRISESSDTEEDCKLNGLRAEFSELVGELKRRHSLNEIAELDALRRPRRRAQSCSGSRKQEVSKPNPFATKKDVQSPLECTVEVEEPKDDGRTDRSSPRRELKEVAYLLGCPLRSLEDSAAICSKIGSNMKNKRECETEDKAEIWSGSESRTDVPACINTSEGNAYASGSDGSADGEQTTLEVVLEKTKHVKRESKSKMSRVREPQTRNETRRAKSCREPSLQRSDADDNSNIQHSSIDRKRQSAWSICDEESDIDSDYLTKYLGPINADLRDLYCSNYLQHKLEMLHKEKTQLEREMILDSYGPYGTDDKLRDADDDDNDDIDGGVLI